MTIESSAIQQFRCWYYLHSNGSLIRKAYYVNGGQEDDFRRSDLVKTWWLVDSSNPLTGFEMLVQAIALARHDRPTRRRALELADHWRMDDAMAGEIIDSNNLPMNIYRDGSHWCAVRRGHINLQKSPAGFGRTILEAVAELLRDCGFTAHGDRRDTLHNALVG